jgi:hypothetical protein
MSLSLITTDRIPADHAEPVRERTPSRLLAVLEALAYAGATVDPAAALAARRFARIRDQELTRGGR